MRGCLFFLLLVFVAALAVMQCPGTNQPEQVEQEAAPPPPPPPPDTQLPVVSEMGLGASSTLVVGGRKLSYGVSAISGSGSDAIVVVWAEPAGGARDSWSLRLDPARSTAEAGPVILRLTGLTPSADGNSVTAGIEVTRKSGAAPDSAAAPAGGQ